MTLACCCGAGSTGKTTAVKLFLDRNPDWVFLPSIVREYYAMRGVASEADYLGNLPPEGRYEFQIGLLEYYVASTREFLEKHAGRDVIMDRSAFDHVAYAVFANPGATLSQVRRATRFADEFAILRPVILYFPYPVSWTGDAAAEDGFRATDAGKNYAVDSLMRRVLVDHYLPSLTHTVGEASPEIRASLIEDVLLRSKLRRAASS